MEIYKAIYGRLSVRSFDEKKDVPKEIVDKILEAGCQAPSAGNIQPWRFWVIRNPELKARIATAALNQRYISEAPVVIVVCSDLDISAEAYSGRGRELYAIQDTACATENILLAAYSEGLGACWVGAFYEEDVAKVLDLPSHIRPLAIVPVGYPLRAGKKPDKMPIEDVVVYAD